MFCFSEIVFRILVQYDLSKFNQRIVTLGDDFSDIKDIKFVVFTFFLWEKLDIPSPRWELRFFNRIEKILSSIVHIGTSNLCSLVYWKILNTLISLEMVFDIVNFSFLINPLVSM